MTYLCDCGQAYRSLAAVLQCQADRHSVAAGNELADAERFSRDLGFDPYEVEAANDDDSN